MDQEVKESIQKFEEKAEFVQTKLQTRQSFREDQRALERRLSKYKRGENSDVNPKSEDSVESDKDRPAVNVDSDEHSKLESIMVDITQEQNVDRTRTLSETTDKEDVEIKLPDNIFVLDESADDSVNQNGINGSDNGKDNTSANSNKTNGHQTGNSVIKENGHAGMKVDVDNANKLNGHAILNGSASLPPKSPSVTNHTSHRLVHNSNSLPNGHTKVSLTPEPRLKLRGTRLYEKNSKLTASSSDHLDKISMRGMSRIGNHGHASQSNQKRTVEPIIVPIVAGAEVKTLPKDGNLKSFSVEEMVTVFRMLHLSEQLILRLATSKVDGKRFSILTDKELEALGMKNPVIRYFRDKSAARKRSGIRKVFML